MSGEVSKPAGRRASVEQLFDRVFAAAGQPLSDDQASRAVLDLREAPAEVDPASLRERGFDSRQQGRFVVARQTLHDYLAQPAFHPALRSALMGEQAGPLALAVTADNWVETRDHPVRSLLDILGELAPGWYPDHPQADELRARMTGWFRALSEGETPATVRDAARDWLTGFHQRVDKLCQRLRQAEEGALRLDYARRHAARVIQRQLAGRPLPDFVARALREQWWPALEWVLLNRGEDSPLFDRAVKALTLLFWSLQPENADENNRDKLKRVTGKLQGQLREVLAEVIADESVRGQLLDDIQVAHTALLHGREMTFVEVTEPASGSVVEDSGAAISRDLLEELSGLSTRDWFEDRSAGQRMRLLIRQDDFQQLLFVSQTGMKLLTTSFEDFAWQLTSQNVVPVAWPVSPRELIVERLEELAERCRRQQAERREAEARETAETESSAEPAQDPAEAVAEPVGDALRARAPGGESEPTAEPEAAEDAEIQSERKRARLLVSGLPLGTWMDFREADGTTGRLKLTLVMSSSDKYVFVSRNGLDRRECRRRDLIDGIVEGTISVLNTDSRYDDTLSRVVDGLQKDNRRAG